ncbi:polysaccharide lyase family 1 protein [Bipolaris maydis ATCC 48331]|uniref:Polysaccharide lyase family 1 protein n=2 Tax=Cochliobolus heterostrophus TaxID=5016 RepID=M2UDT1_COCH5|nr:polysaccharide lyase family 1 protein [Bipolaris maydis ATCC 48331]EMD86153.1 polysaccharide lyase family 1 protein [Bipolaris maydis C5]KAH7551605.1 polysaccharide lyase family 1 protein [Bipolaris maydis]ENI06102.1 polysaccharide lyase family 1 protein [Bipolaris maydis ATCC 48331]KAJ5030159.1 polysaccharide lyase [Bipolaris maydis]KAJ5065159.1 pectin lyase fold/virulence factor [Bipolaris maydis]
MRFFEAATVALTAASTAYGAPMEKRAAAVDELVGFGAGTTGGGSGTGTTVTNCAGLTAAAKVGGVIKIKGTLTGCGIVRFDVPGTSILGVGKDAGITDGGFRFYKTSNVIVRNLKFYRAPEGKDLIDIEATTKVWIDHNDFSSVGITGDKDKYDGLLDAKSGSDYLTFSWNKFHDHWKGSLVGHSDNNGSVDKGKLRVTYHHNSFTAVNSRLPSIRFGTGHIYNSCFNGGVSGINSRMGAQVLVESNSFTNVAKSVVTNLDSDEEGFATEKNNVFSNSPTQITKQGSFTPTYKYTVDPAASVCSIVAKSAGVGVVTF